MPRVRSPKARLATFVGLLSVLAVAAVVVSPVSEGGLRAALEPFGAAAPLAYVPVSALLGVLFVPGPILAGASGLLFGTTTGFFVTLAATLGSSVVAVLAARGAGRAGVEELGDPRVQAVERLLHRRPVAAVALQRLLPAVPDAPCSYLYGLAGLRVWQVALGTLVGAAPRAFSYTAIGDGLGGGGGAIGVIGVVTLALTGLVGIAAAAFVTRRARRERTTRARSDRA